jgi:hypothetical protein
MPFVPIRPTWTKRLLSASAMGGQHLGLILEAGTGWGCLMTYGAGRAASGVSATLIVG